MDRGFTVWLTGLSGAGKSTIARIVSAELVRAGHLVEELDGDVVRERLSPDLGFSREERDANVERIAWLASRLTRHGAAVVVSSISPFEEGRARARAMVEEFGPFVEVHVRAGIEDCARRDPKGLYRKALRGEIPNFTGISDPYEPPVDPELVVDTTVEPARLSARRVLAELARIGQVAPPRGVAA
jgi:adenylylsulfate kinase